MALECRGYGVCAGTRAQSTTGMESWAGGETHDTMGCGGCPPTGWSTGDIRPGKGASAPSLADARVSFPLPAHAVFVHLALRASMGISFWMAASIWLT